MASLCEQFPDDCRGSWVLPSMYVVSALVLMVIGFIIPRMYLDDVGSDYPDNEIENSTRFQIRTGLRGMNICCICSTIIFIFTIANIPVAGLSLTINFISCFISMILLIIIISAGIGYSYNLFRETLGGKTVKDYVQDTAINSIKGFVGDDKFIQLQTLLDTLDEDKIRQIETASTVLDENSEFMSLSENLSVSS